jgi:lysozyme
MRHNRGDYEGAAEAFMMWVKAGGRTLPGLVKRRMDEKKLYLS